MFEDAVKSGYTFMGWYIDANFTNEITEIASSTTGDLTLYAKWQKNSTGDNNTGITPPPTSAGCGGSFDTGVSVAVIVIIAGALLVLKNKFRRN